MDNTELTLYFTIACGVGGCALVILFVLVTILYVRMHRLASDRSNQLNHQTNMMSDFCYTNPTIVPGELLSRRGFSMYSGSDTLEDFPSKNNNMHYGTYHEARSKF